MSDRVGLVTAVHLFLQDKSGAILLSQRANTGYRDGWWSVPAGHVEYRETPFEAMVREAKEEIGLDLLPEKLDLCHIMHRKVLHEKNDRVDFFFICREYADTPINCEQEKCSQIAWFSQGDLPDLVVPYIDKALEACWSTGFNGFSYQEFVEPKNIKV